MRVHETEGVSALFAGDISEGLIIECVCGEEQEILNVDDPNGQPYYCKFCKKEICYRPWYEW